MKTIDDILLQASANPINARPLYEAAMMLQLLEKLRIQQILAHSMPISFPPLDSKQVADFYAGKLVKIG